VLACEHLVYYYTKGPHVYALSVPLTSCLFRCHVEDGSCDRVYFVFAVGNVGRNFGSKAKVCYFSNKFSIPLLCYKYVLRLEVSMNVVLLVNLAETLANVFHYL